MNILFWLYVPIFGYVFYRVVKSKYKSSKRNELKYEEHILQIPQHLCATDNSGDKDLTYEETEPYCQNHIKTSWEVKYKAIRWEDIKSWEYKFVTCTNFKHTILLRITTSNQTISVTDVQHLMKLKRYFKKYAPGKRMVNFSNKLELSGIIISVLIVISILYFFIFI